jgi:PAS domain S-box-containing protein
LAAILETAADAIITIDQHGAIESVNPATERTFGYAAGAMIGPNIEMLMPSPYAAGHEGYLARYVKTGDGKIIAVGPRGDGAPQRRRPDSCRPGRQ